MKSSMHYVLIAFLFFASCRSEESESKQSNTTITEVLPEFTSIPDPTFEKILISIGLDNILDGRIRTQNALNYTGGLDLSNPNPTTTAGILDMTGIQAFRNIIWLNVYDNRNLKELDVSKNTKLISLTVSNTDVSTLDISKCTELLDANFQNLETLPEYGVLHTKGLTSIDFSNNLKLEKIYLIGNRLKTINVRHLTNLTNLWANYNLLEGNLNLSDLSKLDVIVLHNNKLSSLNIKGTNNNGLPRTCMVYNNPTLTQVLVTDVTRVVNHANYLASINNTWYRKDTHTNYVQ